MNDASIAKRYARALFEISEDEAGKEAFGKELSDVCCVIYDNSKLCAVYTGVQFSNLEKKNAIQVLFENKINKNILNFLLLLVDKMRTAYLADISHAYQALLDEAKGIRDATVYSAFDLSDTQLAELADALGKATGKTIRMDMQKDESLLAGIRIRYGDYVIDGSAKARLEQLRNKLTRDNTTTEVMDR